jgi:putative endopeptidase
MLVARNPSRLRPLTLTLTLLFLAGLGAACGSPPAPAPPSTTPPAGSAAATTTAAVPAPQGGGGIDVEGMDTSVAPGQDFFAYANGGWVKATPIPPDRSSYGPGAVLDEESQKRTADLIREVAAAAPAAGSDAKKIADTYASFMDEAAIEAKGIAPLAPRLAGIAKITTRAELSRFLGGTLRADVDLVNATKLHTDDVFGLWVAQDMSDPSRYASFLVQGGLALPDRDYYLATSPRMEEIRTKYRAHIKAVFTLLKMSDEQARAARVFDLEKKIAQAHASLEDTEDVEKGNNHVTRRELETSAPGLDWAAFLGAAGLDKQASFVVWQPAAVRGIAALVAKEPLDAWRDYLAFHAVTHMAAVLPKAFVEEDFSLYGKALRGTPVMRDRWKRAVDATDDALGESVGKLFAERYFPPAEKARVEEMVKNILVAFAKRIDALPWMAKETKTRAKAKLAVLKVGIGYPDKWRDYSGLEVASGDAFGNAERAELFEYKRNLAKLGKAVDRGEWVMTPQTVNAVNLPVMNALNFPAAILQPPFLDPKRPVAMDYAATGATIGHEICHSFDAQGALFDDAGRLHNWWTPEDFAHFKSASDALAKQYDAYKPFPDAQVNGKQTLGENMADVAGLAAAYDAYRVAFGGKAAPTVGGFTGDQQFFIAFAQSWRGKLREPAARQRLVTDGHAPAEYRADTVRNLDAWYDAFAVKAGQALYLGSDARVRIW